MRWCVDVGFDAAEESSLLFRLDSEDVNIVPLDMCLGGTKTAARFHLDYERARHELATYTSNIGILPPCERMSVLA